MELELSLLLILGGVALLAGFIDTLAGGGGLLTLPALSVALLNGWHLHTTDAADESSGAGMVAFILISRRRFAETLVGPRHAVRWSVLGTRSATARREATVTAVP